MCICIYSYVYVLMHTYVTMYKDNHVALVF